ncbi:iron ABC transporter ATP-binding protein FetA [Mixta theicola]|uniref:Iron ABC transporter ATP-binding protein FetA n=1 Tax=Mixta theicola TaxID=1458355 RepID=A0A2K1QF27_9GAMM|nr:ATP-binding cassette domain-containing protein [Mixta theicola]PNS13627.1 iron ABC transporter ATP-binding protein FetA [Mixta theicola]GLR09956.1 ABC transporter ATP-binding protein [Mixta theicola]
MVMEIPALAVRDVSYRLADKVLLAPLSFTLRQHEFVWLTGPSGSGKTTLLKILAALLTPTTGTIAFRGEEITALKPETWRQQVSYCCQTPQLFGESVYDNLAFPWQIRQRRPEKQALRASLAQLNLAPSMLEQPITDLSGGERQRVALLRNLQFPPAILLLDEVTSALDAENKARVKQVIRQTAQQQPMSVLWISHDPQETDDGSRVIALTRMEAAQ